MQIQYIMLLLLTVPYGSYCELYKNLRYAHLPYFVQHSLLVSVGTVFLGF